MTEPGWPIPGEVDVPWTAAAEPVGAGVGGETSQSWSEQAATAAPADLQWAAPEQVIEDIPQWAPVEEPVAEDIPQWTPPEQVVEAAAPEASTVTPVPSRRRPPRRTPGSPRRTSGPPTARRLRPRTPR